MGFQLFRILKNQSLKVYGNKMYLGYIMKNDDGTHTPKVIAKPLKSFMWEEYSGNRFGE